MPTNKLLFAMAVIDNRLLIDLGEPVVCMDLQKNDVEDLITKMQKKIELMK